MTTNAMTFGQDFLVSAKLSASFNTKNAIAWHPWAIRSQNHSATSLIRPIWRIFKGLEAADVVS
jgi:hypothetical protein